MRNTTKLATLGRPAILLLFICFSLPGIAQFGIADDFFAKGLTDLEMKNSDTAIEQFTLALAENPNLTQVLFYRSEAYIAAGKPNLALADLTALLQAEPLHLRALTARGQLHYDMRSYEAALADFNRVLALHQSAEGHLNVGLVHKAMGQPDKAIIAFRAALQIAPAMAAAYCSMADAFADKGSGFYKQAFHYWHVALQHNPAEVLALKNRGKLYQQLGHIDNAVDDFTVVLSFYEDYEAYLYLAQCHLEQKQLDDANRCIYYALNLGDDDPEVYFTLGLIEMEAEEYNKAIECFHIARGLNDTNPHYLRYIGLAEYHVGNPYAAIRAFDAYTDLVGIDAEVEIYIQMCYENIENNDAAANKTQGTGALTKPYSSSTTAPFSGDIFEEE